MTRRVFIFSLLPFLYLLLMLFTVDSGLTIDLGRQIKMGEIISQCRCVPQTNTFSQNFSSFPTINHSWLSELIFYQLASLFGLTSLLHLKLILIISTFTIIYLLAIKKDAPFTSALFATLSIAILAPRIIVKPELFSYLFIALLLLIFNLYKRTQNTLFLWFIPPIIALWVNLHIYFFIGILLFLFFITEQYLTHKKRKSNLILLTSSVLLAPLINPSFIHGAIYPLLIFHNYGIAISENYPSVSFFTIFHPLSPQFFTLVLFELLSACAIAGVLAYPQKKLIAKKLNILLATILSQCLIRCIAIFSLLGLPFLTDEYIFISQNAMPHIRKKFTYALNTVLSLLFLTLLILQLNQLLSYKAFGLSFQPPPDSAVNFLLKNNLHGPIFNNLTLGNYLIYRLYPKEKVFVDARPEAYPASFLQDYQQMIKKPNYFNVQADKYKFNIIFYNLFEYPEESRTLLLYLANHNKWAPVFWDGNVIIFVRNTPENAKLIKANSNVKKLFLLQLR